MKRLELVVLLLAGLMACTGGDQTTTTSAVPDAARNQINPMPREQLQQGGKFTFPINSVPANFNYYQLDGTLQDGYWLLSAAMPALFHSDAAAAPVWNPNMLASEPEMREGEKQVIVFRLHPEAVWYDGTPITWEDLHWQWKAANGTDQRYQISGSTGYDLIESIVRGADDKEAIVTFATPYADWTALFDPLYPASTNRDPKIFNEGWKDRLLTTAGPFRLADVNQTTKTYTLVRNEKWWGTPAILDTLVYRFIPLDAQIDALANGEIDAMDLGPDVNKLTRAKGMSHIEVRAAGGPNFRHITLNGTSPNLQDVNVRRAIAMGIDRSTIARALLGPLGIEPASLDNHIFMSNQQGYRDNAGELGTHNPERAAQLLDSLGWKLDGNVRKKDGKALELTLVIPATVIHSRQESELVQNMLGQIGVTVKISTVPVNAFFANYVTPGEFDMTIFSWMGTAYPISSGKSIYVKPKPAPGGGMDVQQNYARIGSDELDQLFDQATSELDRNKAIDLANRIDSLIWWSVHSLPMYQRPELFATHRNLANFGAYGFMRPWKFQDMGWVKE